MPPRPWVEAVVPAVAVVPLAPADPGDAEPPLLVAPPEPAALSTGVLTLVPLPLLQAARRDDFKHTSAMAIRVFDIRLLARSVR